MAKLTAQLQAVQRENDIVADLLQRSRHDLAVSQAHTHELLTSVAKIEDERSSCVSENARLKVLLEETAGIKECVQRCPPCDEASERPESLYGNFGSQVCSLWCCGAASGEICNASTVLLCNLSSASLSGLLLLFVEVGYVGKVINNLHTKHLCIIAHRALHLTNCILLRADSPT